MAPRWSVADMPDLTGVVAVVTGGNAGLGLATVHQLVARGAHVVVTSRDLARGRAAVDGLGPQRGSTEVLTLDLADLHSVESFAKEVRTRHTSLDLLVNNAGIMMVPPAVTVDGFESQFGTNHLGHFALTGHLIDLLLAAPAARVVTVSSQAHRAGVIDPTAHEAPGADYARTRAYGTSKLANLQFTYELQRRLTAAGSRAAALAAHPGTAGTGLSDHLFPTRFRALQPVFRRLTQTPEDGALPTLRAATDPGALGGQYYGPDRLGQQRGRPVVVASNPESYDATAARELWERSEELTGVSFLS